MYTYKNQEMMESEKVKTPFDVHPGSICNTQYTAVPRDEEALV
jgi:hypothetical protein